MPLGTMGVGCSNSKPSGFQVHEIRDILNFKIVIIGESGVGKTGIFSRYVKNQFQSLHKPTRRPVVENVLKKVNIPDDMVASITLWDLPSNEDISMIDSYYRNVDAAIVVVDLNDEDSIRLAGSLKQEFTSRATKALTVTETLGNGNVAITTEKASFDPRTIPVLLLGNKYDIVEAKSQEERLKHMFEKPVLDDLSFSGSTEIQPFIPEDEEGVRGDHEAKDAKLSVKRRRHGRRYSLEEVQKPHCIKLLEQVENKYGFVGSLAVSARHPDGSVEMAFQALARHLLETVRPEKMKLPKGEQEDILRKKKKKAKMDEHQFVFYCGAENMDNVFSKCYAPVKRADDYETYYGMVLNKFMQSCIDHGFVQGVRCSMEDCIIGINKAICDLENVHMNIIEERGFVRLAYTENHQVKIPDEIEVTLDIFNLEYASLCRSIQKETSLLEAVLSRLHDAVADMSSQLLDKYGKRADNYIHVCDKNRARIVFARKQVADCISNIETAMAKIKTAVIW